MIVRLEKARNLHNRFGFDRAVPSGASLPGGAYDDPTDLVEGIRRGESNSVETLCNLMHAQAYYQLARQVGVQYREDKFHDLVVSVLEAIHSGSLRRPERLLSFVYTITRRGVAAQIRANIKARRCTSLDEAGFYPGKSNTPEAAASQSEMQKKIATLLGTLCARDRGYSTRFLSSRTSPGSNLRRDATHGDAVQTV